MRSSLFFITLSLTLICSNCIRPGMAVQISKTGMKSVIPSVISDLNKILTNVVYDKNVKEEGFEISKVIFSTRRITPEQISISQKAPAETLTFDLFNLSQDGTFEISIAIDRFVETTNASFSIQMKKCSAVITFRKFDDKDPLPFIDISVEDAEFDFLSMDVKIESQNIPEATRNYVISTMKSRTLVKVLEDSKRIIQELVTKSGDQVVRDNFKTLYIIPHTTVNFRTVIVEQPLINSDYLLFPIDGVFFKESDGYNRDIEPLPLNYFSSEKLATTVMSNASMTYLLRALKGYKYDFKVLLIDFEVLILNKNPEAFFIESGIKIKDFKVQASGSFFFLKQDLIITADMMIIYTGINLKNQTFGLKIKEFWITDLEADGFIPFFDYIKQYIIIKIEEYAVTGDPIEVTLSDLPNEIVLSSLEFLVQNNQLNILTNLQINPTQQFCPNQI